MRATPHWSAVEGSVVFPIFAEERPTDTKGPTDGTDRATEPEGESGLARQIEAALSNWDGRRPVPRAGIQNNRGEGRPEGAALPRLHGSRRRRRPLRAAR